MSWCEQARAKLAAMEQLVAQGRGGALVQGGGCTEPGGGIVPTTRTAHEMAALLRRLLDSHPCPAPTSPPPFGRPHGHIGGSYDWWWWNIGRPAGMPYAPSRMEQLSRNGVPVIGFGLGDKCGFQSRCPPLGEDCPASYGGGLGQAEEIVAPVVAAHSPLALALAGGAAAAATGWAIEELWSSIRGRGRQR